VRAAAAAMVLALGLGRGPSARSALGPRYGGELRIAVAEAATTVEPSVPRSLADRILAGLMHETLLGVDDEGRPRPALVQSWASAADGREWTLRLAAATFHDGAPVGSADAVRGLRRFLRSESAAAAHLARALEGGDEYRRRGTDALPGLTALDEARLVLRFRVPTAVPLAPLASPAAAIVSGRGAGAGPFVPTTPPSARGVSATAFGRHVRGRPFLDVVRLIAVPPDRAARSEGLAADVAASATPLPPAAGLLLLLLDPAAPPLADGRVRALIAASVDRAQLARHFLPGGEAAENLLAPTLLPALPIPPPRVPPGPASVSGRLVLRVSSDVPQSASQRVVAHLSALGLEVQAVAAPVASTAPGSPRLVVWYPEVAEAGLALEELAALAGSAAAVHTALEAADSVRDFDRRRADLQRIEESLRATHVLVPLARLPLPLGARSGVHALRATASGALVVENAWVEP
jgi:MarR-like DNA-binding transcriptional regulator SgrR of sgrS sRNA